MSTAKKIGIILVLIGVCLPTATLPFITEFRPQPDICLTSNFFGNLGNMVAVFGQEPVNISSKALAGAGPSLAIPYRYLFSTGIILFCTGLGVILLSTGKPPASNQ